MVVAAPSPSGTIACDTNRMESLLLVGDEGWMKWMKMLFTSSRVMVSMTAASCSSARDQHILSLKRERRTSFEVEVSRVNMSPKTFLFFLHVLELLSFLLHNSISILDELVFRHLLQDPLVVFQKRINASLEEVWVSFGLHAEPEPKRGRTRPFTTGNTVPQLLLRPQSIEEGFIHHLCEKIQPWSNLFVRNIPYMAVVRQGRVWFLFIGYKVCVDKVAT